MTPSLSSSRACFVSMTALAFSAMACGGSRFAPTAKDGAADAGDDVDKSAIIICSPCSPGQAGDGGEDAAVETGADADAAAETGVDVDAAAETGVDVDAAAETGVDVDAAAETGVDVDAAQRVDGEAVAADAAATGSPEAGSLDGPQTTCTASSTDPANCGSCGHVCLPGTCAGGQCQPFVLATNTNAIGASTALTDGTAYYDFAGSNLNAFDKNTGALTGTALFVQQGVVFTEDSTNLYAASSGVFTSQICILSKSTIQNLGGCLYPVGNDPGIQSVVQVGSHLWWLDRAHVLWSGNTGGAPATVLDSTAGLILTGDAAGLVWFEMSNALVTASTSFAPGQMPTTLSTPSGSAPGSAIGGVVSQLLVVDAANAYWYNLSYGAIYQSPRNGAAFIELASSTDSPENLAVDSTSVYWTDQAAGTVSRVPIGGGPTQTIATLQYNPSGVAVDSAAVYWTTGNGEGSALVKVFK
jgi:hypothetical protein